MTSTNVTVDAMSKVAKSNIRKDSDKKVRRFEHKSTFDTSGTVSCLVTGLMVAAWEKFRGRASTSFALSRALLQFAFLHNFEWRRAMNTVESFYTCSKTRFREFDRSHFMAHTLVDSAAFLCLGIYPINPLLSLIVSKLKTHVKSDVKTPTETERFFNYLNNGIAPEGPIKTKFVVYNDNIEFTGERQPTVAKRVVLKINDNTVALLRANVQLTIRKATDHELESYEQTGVITKYHSKASKLIARKTTRDEVEEAVEDLGAIIEETVDQNIVDPDYFNEQGFKDLI